MSDSHRCAVGSGSMDGRCWSWVQAWEQLHQIGVLWREGAARDTMIIYGERGLFVGSLEERNWFGCFA